MTGDAVVNQELARKYEAVAYAAQSNALSHPRHLATVATLFGLAPPEVATCRVLGAGWALPDARRAARELGLSNVIFRQQDLSTLSDDPDAFDYIIAHGVYSW